MEFRIKGRCRRDSALHPLFKSEKSGRQPLIKKARSLPAVPVEGLPAVPVEGLPAVPVEGLPAVPVEGLPAVNLAGYENSKVEARGAFVMEFSVFLLDLS